MIKTENYTINNIPFVRTYSDDNRYVVRDGVEYTEACDLASLNRTYAEGRTIVEDEESEDIEPMIAKDNISTGQYFSINDNLYIATQSIPAGEDIIIGTNAVETTIADELNNLKENE